MHLLQFRNPVDDAEPDIVAELDLDHLPGQTFADLVHVVHRELNLSPASLDEVIEQQGGEITHFFIVRMFAEIQYLGHGGFNVSLWWRILIAEARSGPQ
jgi:hypothetical protein